MSRRRLLCAAVLVFEAVGVAMSIPVLVFVVGWPVGRSVSWGAGIAVACVLVSGLLGRSWGYAAGHLIQVATLALGFALPAMFVVGGVFAALWLTGYVVGTRIDVDRARREAAAR